MFFEVDPEMIRKHMEAVKSAREAQEAERPLDTSTEEPGIRILQGLDGGFIIDEPSLTSVIEVTDDPWTWDMLDRTSILAQGLGAANWIPLSKIKHYVEGMPPRA